MKNPLRCRDRHPEPFHERDCIMGHCLNCHENHCAFDFCIPDPIGILLLGFQFVKKRPIIRPSEVPIFN